MAGKDAGDYLGDGDTYKMTSDGSGSKGDLVKVNSSGQVTPTTANGDAFIGVLAEDSPSSSGDEVGVIFHGRVGLTAGGSISEGDLLQADASTNGRVVTADSNEGLATAVDEGGTDTYDIYTRALVSLEGSVSSGDVFEAYLA